MLSATFANRLNVARRDGVLHRGVDPARASAKLLTLYEGILVLIRAGHDKAELEQMVIAEFNRREDHHDA